ncbi:unnamed protein product [Gemmataceae bacterium]|nr:unnamed protein product [Gemmataceae bacterium]VTT99618.1 unnamed protein product [Gemmataceae bacterium]
MTNRTVLSLGTAVAAGTAGCEPRKEAVVSAVNNEPITRPETSVPMTPSYNPPAWTPS